MITVSAKITTSCLLAELWLEEKRTPFARKGLLDYFGSLRKALGHTAVPKFPGKKFEDMVTAAEYRAAEEAVWWAELQPGWPEPTRAELIAEAPLEMLERGIEGYGVPRLSVWVDIVTSRVSVTLERHELKLEIDHMILGTISAAEKWVLKDYKKVGRKHLIRVKLFEGAEAAMAQVLKETSGYRKKAYSRLFDVINQPIEEWWRFVETLKGEGKELL